MEITLIESVLFSQYVTEGHEFENYSQNNTDFKSFSSHITFSKRNNGQDRNPLLPHKSAGRRDICNLRPLKTENNRILICYATIYHLKTFTDCILDSLQIKIWNPNTH